MAQAGLTPGATPGYGNQASAPPLSQASAGTPAGGTDPTLEPGQYPGSLFGQALPQGTGAPGSQGAQAGAGVDPSNEPGQLNEGISGLGPDFIAHTGAPGGSGQQNTGGGPDSVTYTRPGSYLTGTYTSDTVRDTISGPSDWTQAIDGSYGGSVQIPGLNMPSGTGAGEGKVLKGGRGGGP